MSSNVRLPVLADSATRLPAADDRDLLQVGDLARETGKTVRAIHLYEELDLVRPVRRSKGGYRLYGPEALLRIRWIVKLQDMGLSLTDIKAVVKDWEQEGSASRAMTKMRATYETKLLETREHLERLRALERELVASLAYLDVCGDACEGERHLDACPRCEHHAGERPVPELVAGFRA